MGGVAGKTVILAGAHHRDRVILDAMHRLRDGGAVVVVQIVNDAAVDDMRSLAIELLAHRPRIDVLAFVGARRGFDRAVLQPYLLTRLLADRVAESHGRVLWSVDGSYRTATFDPDAPQGRGRHAGASYQLARALLVHAWPRRDERIGVAGFEPDSSTLFHLCGTDEPLDGGHFVDSRRVADERAAIDDLCANRVWERCATETRLDP